MLRFPAVPEFWADGKEHLRLIALALNGLLRGKSNNVEEVTLAASATSTAKTVLGVTENTVALLSARTSTAAAATGVYAVTTKDTVTIHHDSHAATDRTFGVVLVG